MRSYNNLFAQMLTDQSMTTAFMDASKGKREREDVKWVLSHLDSEKENLREILDTETLRLVKHPSCVIREANCHKQREIVKPNFRYEQVVHHLVVNRLKPIVLHGFYEYSCGSIPERGCHYGKKYVEKWVREYPKDQKVYILKMDIRHFFENIDHDILKNKLTKVIRDKKFLRLLYQIIDNHPQGLPLGFYTSQWFANFYLKEFDHYVKEVLHAEHYIRYMDDMVIFDTDKAILHEMRKKISEYLSVELNVELKDNWQVFPLAENREDNHARPLDFMGFKFYRNHTTLRKSILKHIRRKSARINAKIRTHQNVTWKDASSIVSYMGWITHSNTYHYYFTYIRSNVIIRSMKYKVSKHHRKESKHYDRLEISAGFSNRPSVGGRYLFKYDNCVPA